MPIHYTLNNGNDSPWIWSTMHASWTWSKWSCCAVVATTAPLTMQPITATQTNTACNAEALQPLECYQCYMQTHVTPNCNIATLPAVLWHCTGVTLPCIKHDSHSTYTCKCLASLTVVQLLLQQPQLCTQKAQQHSSGWGMSTNAFFLWRPMFMHMNDLLMFLGSYVWCGMLGSYLVALTLWNVYKYIKCTWNKPWWKGVDTEVRMVCGCWMAGGWWLGGTPAYYCRCGGADKN